MLILLLSSISQAQMTKTILILLFVTTSVGLFGQTLTKFQFAQVSPCGGDSSKIQSVTKADGLTEIKLRTYAPCGSNLKGEVKLMPNGILDLRFEVKPNKYKNKKGEEYELLEISECDCMFDFTYQISGVSYIDQTLITVKGKSLLEINQQSIISEIEINYDSIRQQPSSHSHR